MVPAPTSSILSRKLPISRQALEALNKAKSTSSNSELRGLTNTVIRAAFKDGNDIDEDASKYVFNRLLSGISVSAGNTRINFSTILLVLIRAVVKEGGSEALNNIVATVKNMYGANGSFELGYSGAERERALGTLASCAAVVNATDGQISPSIGKDLIGLLRLTVNGQASKWRLGFSAIDVIIKLLDGMNETNRKGLTKQLWNWCEDRKTTEDGLLLAMLMFTKYKLVETKAINTLYPQLKGDFTKAVMDSIEHGFSLLETCQSKETTKKDSHPTLIVPISWKEALKYLATKEGRTHLGGVGIFWKQVIVPKLVENNRSPERSILALELTALCLESITDIDSFKIIFDSQSASLFSSLEAIANSRKRKNRIRESRVTEYLRSHIKSKVFEFGGSIVTETSRSTRSTDESMALLNEFLLWGVREGILNQVLQNDSLAKALKLYNKTDAVSLFISVVKEFIYPNAKSNGHTRSQSASESSIRTAVLRFVFALATHHSFLAKDAVKIVLMYSIFEVSDSFPTHLCDFEFLHLSNKSDEMEKGVISMVPESPLSVSIRGLGFRRLIDFLNTARLEEEDVNALPAVSINVLGKLVGEGELSPKGTDTTNEDHVERIACFKEKILPLMGEEDFKSISDSHKPLLDAIRMAASYIGLFLLEPTTEESIIVEEPNQIVEITGMLETCLSSLKNLSKKKSRKSLKNRKQPVNQNTPDVLEQITHIITILCGMDAASYRQIAVRIITCLGPCMDDRGLAVLFDAMESYLFVPDKDENDSDVEEIFEPQDSDENNEVIRIAAVESESNDQNSSDAGTDEDEDTPEVEAKKPKKRTKKMQSKKKNVESKTEMSDSESDPEEMDVDLEDVDPEVLEEFDKRIGSHLKLMKTQKKIATQRRLKSEFRFIKVSRLLTAIDTVARTLRMRLEKSDVDDMRLPIVFLDLHVRLFEFALSETADNLRYLSQVCGIASKQMQISPSSISKNITDSETVKEIIDRFFKALIECNAERKPSDNDIRTVSKSAGSLITVLLTATSEDVNTFASYYSQLMKKIFEPTRHFACPGLFSSFVQKYPQMCVVLLSNVESCMFDEMSKSMRHTASEMILLLANCAHQNHGDKNEDVAPFWEKLVTMVEKKCNPKLIKSDWNRGAVLNLGQACSLGLKSGALPEKKTSKLLEGMVGSIRRTERDRKKLLKSFNVTNTKQRGGTEVAK